MWRIQTGRSNLTLAAAILIGGAAIASEAGTAEKLTELRLSLTPVTVGNLELRAGAARGIFAKQGLTLKFNDLPSGTENIAAIVGGSADIAYGDLFAGVHAVKNGFDIKFISPNNHTTRKIYYLTNKDSDIKEPKDLAGKNLGLGAVPLLAVYAKAFLRHNGVDPESVKLNRIRQLTTLGDALSAKHIDALQFHIASNVFQWIGRYQFRIVGDPDTSAFQNPKATQAGFFTTTKWATENTDLVERFVRGVRETNAWYAKLSSVEKAAVIKEQSGIDLIQLDRETPGVLDAAAITNVVVGPIDIPATQSWIDIGHQYGGVPKIDLETILFKTAR